MNIILFDDKHRANFYPLSFTRTISHLRLGISTLFEKWEELTKETVSFYTQDYLQQKFRLKITTDNFLINARYLANKKLFDQIVSLLPGQGLMGKPIDGSSDRDLVACRLSDKQLAAGEMSANPAGPTVSEPLTACITWPEDLVTLNRAALEEDYATLSAKKRSAQVSSSNNILGDRLFLEDGVSCEFATINTLTGPVYLGKNSVVMEGCHIRGPFALLDQSTLKMGAKIYGATTIGPHSTVGGEVKNSIVTGYSNKSHEGYLGDSVLGEWCNLGADTNTSNMKNNLKQVSLFNYSSGSQRLTQLQFLGLIMGDHSKSGINATFNTGTVIGVGVNYYGSRLSPAFIPDFSWGEAGELIEHDLPKMIETAKRVLSRREMELDLNDTAILEAVYTITAPFRNKFS